MRLFAIFETPWEKRVFVGGSMGLSPIMEQIRDIVNEAGYDAILAADFETPEDITIYHKCLLLLHCCKYAIFDVSENAGQLIELERPSEYGVTTLVIWPINEDNAITEMLKSSLEMKGIEQKTYGNFTEMEMAISKFLKREGLPSTEETAERVSHAKKAVIKLATDKKKAGEDIFLLDKETIQIAVSAYYFDEQDSGHFFPVGDSPGTSLDILIARGGGEINFHLLVGNYLVSEPESSHMVGGSYIWHINLTGTVDTTYKGVYP